MKTETDFWGRVDKSAECWPWTGSINKKGYGQFNWGGFSERLAHRMAFRLTRGPIPVGLEIDHVCRNRRCCRPDHLQLVTHAENTFLGFRRKVSCPRGHDLTVPRARLSAEPTSHSNCRACKQLRERDSYRRSGRWQGQTRLDSRSLINPLALDK